ncbi:uncharacterized protein LOC135066778 isoform X2 [Pseudophryne corroboree]|uniref:uncharacterized protein LOC135066778 isoform X2 n=1 Tax=Pseudophryne corroboree TaxID=495146 RepID=UPI003081E4A2
MMSIEGRTLQFAEWDTGKRRLRYMFLCPPCSFTLYHGQKVEDNMIPVFLDFKFERLRLPGGLNNLWFYSIQGLFKVAFDMYSREEQLAVIESLQGLWKSHLKDDPLSKSYDLNICLGDREYEVPVYNQAEEPKSHDQLGCSSPTNEIPRVLRSIPTEHNYCMTKQDGVRIPQVNVGNDFFIQRIKCLWSMCSTTVINLSGQLMKTVVALLDVVEQALSGHMYLDKMITSIVELLEAASHLQDKDDTEKEGYSVYDNRLLLEVSSWLGNRFYSENDRISQQVEEFKRKHIDRISDLPPAEELIAALFPNAMKVFLLKWMGLYDDASVSKLQSEYPILLLILEFANRNLITGVAHVLYSTLICK